MPYGVVPPRNTPRYSTVEINGKPVTARFDEAPIQAHPVRLTIRANVALPDALGSYGYLNRIDDHFKPFPKTRRSLRKRKMVYTGYITNEGLDNVLDVIAEYDGVTTTVVYL